MSLLPRNGFHRPDPTPAERMARRLADAVRSRQLDKAPIALARWADQFDKLLRRKDREEVEETLAWYISNIGGEYIPQAYSAEGFRKKYDQIRRHLDDTPGSELLSPDALTVLRRLEGLSWPAGVDVLLPRLVQRSLNAYTPFRARVLRLAEQAPGLALRTACARRSRLLRKLERFIAHLKEAHQLGKPTDFIEDWFRRLNDILSKWSAWGGAAGSLAFAEGSPWLRKLGRQWSHEYFDSSVYWDELIKEVQSGEHGS
jgi:hypothetical protein